MSRTKGFTLASLLIVMAVIALLSAILFPRICQSGDTPNGAASQYGQVSDSSGS